MEYLVTFEDGSDGYLSHHGVLGMKWGVRNAETRARYDRQGVKERYRKEFPLGRNQNEGKSIVLPDGSTKYRKGYVFNRVGGETLAFNGAGALYVSSGEDDAARYVKALGPTPMGKLLNEYGSHLQKIEVSSDLKCCSKDQFRHGVLELVRKDPKLAKKMANSFYSLAFTEQDMASSDFVKKAISDKNSREARQWSVLANTLLADPEYTAESKKIIEYFKSNYDALPDIHDTMAGTSKTALMIINPDKVKMSQATVIDKETMKNAKLYVKRLEKLPTSEFKALANN